MLRLTYNLYKRAEKKCWHINVDPLKMTKDSNDIHCRVNAARKLAEKIDENERYSGSICRVEVGLASYLLVSSLQHLMWWAAMESKSDLTDKNVYANIRFGKASTKNWRDQCEQWLIEPYRSRVLDVSKLAEERENYKWLNALSNHDKHKCTVVFKDNESLNFARRKIIELANFIDDSIKYLNDGVPFRSKLSDADKIPENTKQWTDAKLLEMLISRRIGYAEKLIVDLENIIDKHLKERHGSAKIDKKINADGKVQYKVSAKDLLVPVQWSIETGMIGHLLRSALDHMVCALLVRSGKEPTPRSKFPIPGSDYDFQSGRRDKNREQMLMDLSVGDKQKVERMLDPMHPSMGGVFGDLISLDSLRKTDAHRHISIEISVLDGLSQDWHKRADEALDRSERPPDPTPDDVKFAVRFDNQAAANRSMRYGGEVIQSCYEFLDAVKSVGKYLDFDV